jgi:hypothetical protein
MTTARPGEKLSRPRNNINRLKEILAFPVANGGIVCPWAAYPQRQCNDVAKLREYLAFSSPCSLAAALTTPSSTNIGYNHDFGYK